MPLYGLVDYRLRADRPLEQVIELFASPKAAEDALCDVLRDGSSWVDALGVLELPLVEYQAIQPSRN